MNRLNQRKLETGLRFFYAIWVLSRAKGPMRGKLQKTDVVIK